MPACKVATYFVEKLKERHDTPFFLTAEFVKPHMLFSVPKKRFDLFPLETIQLPPHRADDAKNRRRLTAD